MDHSDVTPESINGMSLVLFLPHDHLKRPPDKKDASLSINGDTEKSGSQVTVQEEFLQDGGLQGWLVVFGA